MDRMDWVQAVVRTRVLEKELLSHVKLEQMIEAKDISEVWKILKTTSYAKYVHEQIDDYQYETILTNALIEQYNMMEEISHDRSIINLLKLKYDYHNLKVLLKESFLQTDLSYLYSPISTFSVERVKTAIQEESVTDLDEHIQDAIQKVQSDFNEKNDPQRIEIILDHLYIDELYNRIKTSQMPLLFRYVKAMIDFLNIRTVIRVQKQKKDLSFLKEALFDYGNIDREQILYSLHDSVRTIIEKFQHEEISKSLIRGLQSYESTNRLTTFEKEMDHYLMGIMEEAKYIHFGPEPLLAYVLKKEAEIKNLRMIFVSKLNRISAEKIKQRVREVHV